VAVTIRLAREAFFDKSFNSLTLIEENENNSRKRVFNFWVIKKEST